MPESSPKVVVDTSALISVVHGGLLDLILKEFQIVVSDLVIEELKKTSKYQDSAG